MLKTNVRRHLPMRASTKSLEQLYEETCPARTDFLLLEDTLNFDWDYFWDSYFCTIQGVSTMYESFEKLPSDDKNRDRFEVVSSNGGTFEVYINYIPNVRAAETVLGTMASNLKDRVVLNDLLKTVQSTTLPVLNINFRDSEHNTSLTGKQGNHSFSVINGVKHSIVQSLHDRSEQLPDVLFFRILKNEPQKLEFFVRVFGRKFPHLKKHYLDTTETKYNLVYFF